MNKQKIITWILFFLLFFLTLQLFQKKEVPPPPSGTPITVTVLKDGYASGEEVSVEIFNNTNDVITIPTACPKNPLRVLTWTGSAFEEKTAEAALPCEPEQTSLTLLPQTKTPVSFRYWNYSLFGEPGRYKVALALAAGTTTGSFESPEFTVEEAGFWRKLFRTALYQPLYNVLVFFVDVAPARDLGVAIILLTLLIRLILLVPSQRAIESQRRMQELQPKLEHIKKKFAGNQEKIAQETLQVWKEHKVNPFGSCLPLLIQFPVLIALFYVIQNGLNPDNTYLLYSPLKDVDLSNIHTNFLGILELTKVNAFILPLIIGLLQFAQLKLTMAKKKTADSPAQSSEMESASKMMVYIMPVMIALFTASVPAGVGLYWGISTLFGIGQQLVANRKVMLKSNTVS